MNIELCPKCNSIDLIMRAQNFQVTTYSCCSCKHVWKGFFRFNIPAKKIPTAVDDRQIFMIDDPSWIIEKTELQNEKN